MKMFPGCRSACTKPSSKIIFSSVARPRRATRFGSERVAAVARIFVPAMKLMVRTRSVDSASITSGNTTSGWRLEVGAEAPVVRRLDAEIELREYGAPELLQRLDRRRASRSTGSARSARAHIAHHRQIEGADLDHVGAAHLDRHDASVGQARLVDLRHRRATRSARARTPRRSTPSGRPRSASMVRTTCSNGNGPTWSCSSASAVGDVLGNQVGARAHDLADLDEGRAQLRGRGRP